MKMDIENIGYRWKGIYSPYLAYKENDVVFKDGGAYVIRNNTPQPFALGQQDAVLKGHLLTGGVSVGGIYGMTLHSNGSSVEFRFTNDRNGTVVTNLMRTNFGGSQPAQHSMLFMMLNGDIKGIGSNSDGQLGCGLPNVNKARPTKAAFPAGTPKIVEIISNHTETFYLDASGTLWHSGQNYEGASGTGVQSNVPRKINGYGDLGATTKVVKVFTNHDYYGNRAQGCIDSNGLVYMWGNNTSGMCGWGNTTASTYPKIVPISRTTPIKDAFIASGGYGATYLIDTLGKLWVAGNGDVSGYGKEVYDHRLLMPWGIDKAVKLVRATESDAHWAAGAQYYRTVRVLLEDGTLYGWGNDGGQVGGSWGTGLTGDVYPDSPLFPVKMLTGVKDVYSCAGGYQKTIALMTDGTVKYTGHNSYGTSTTGSELTTWTTIGGTTLTGITKLRMYGGTYGATIIALRNDGKVVTWGYGASGCCGTGAILDDNPTPSFMLLDKVVIDFEANGGCYGGYNDIAYYLLTKDGQVYVTGSGTSMKNGDVNSYNRATPTPVIF